LDEEYPAPIFPFEFNPKDKFLNVTDLWVSLIVRSPSYGYYFNATFEITLNNETLTAVTGVFVPLTPFAMASLHLTELAQNITKGINTLEIRAWAWDTIGPTGSRTFLVAHRLDVLITYEYQAR
jgi:hypothetical protein